MRLIVEGREAVEKGRAGRWALGAAAIAVLAIVTYARVRYVDALPGGYFVKYVYFSQEALEGRLDPERLADLSPGYLWFVTGLRGPLQMSLGAIRQLQVVMLGLVSACAALVAWRFGGILAGGAAAVIVLSNRAALVNATDFEPETLILALEAIALALLVRPRGQQVRGPAFLGGGLALGVAAACRPAALLLGLALGAWLAFDRRRSRVGLRVLTLALVPGLLLPIAVVLAVNRSLSGGATLMDPGTVFYEGMNPHATGYAGATPRIVRELEPTIPGPDTLHVAYRVVAGHALGGSMASREESNRYWAERALAYVRLNPAAAVQLVARKALFAIHSHDAFDVPSMAIMERRMSGPLFMSFGLAASLAAAGALLALLGRSRAAAGVPPLVLAACCAVLPMLVFFVSARHRNPLLLPVAILAGLAVTEFVAGLRRGDRRRTLLIGLGTAGLALALNRDGAREREDSYLWTASLEAARLVDEATRGDLRPDAAEVQMAVAATWLPESAPPVRREVLRAVAERVAAGGVGPEGLFGAGIVLDQAGAYDAAERVFATLMEAGYQPHRRGLSVSSVAWYRARTALHSGRRAEALRWLAAAHSEAPDEPPVLAMAAVAGGDAASSERLATLFDPLTAELALREAHLDACGSGPGTSRCLEEGFARLEALASVLPAWNGPREAELRARHRCADGS